MLEELCAMVLSFSYNGNDVIAITLLIKKLYFHVFMLQFVFHIFMLQFVFPVICTRDL